MDISTVNLVIDVATKVVSGAAIVAAALPNTSDRTHAVFKILRGFLDVLAVNIGNAKNQVKI